MCCQVGLKQAEQLDMQNNDRICSQVGLMQAKELYMLTNGPYMQ
jgi:hypothetical protein